MNRNNVHRIAAIFNIKIYVLATVISPFYLVYVCRLHAPLSIIALNSRQ